MEDCILNSLWIIRISGLHYGLTNAPASFQQLYEQSFQGYIGRVHGYCLPT